MRREPWRSCLEPSRASDQSQHESLGVETLVVPTLEHCSDRVHFCAGELVAVPAHLAHCTCGHWSDGLVAAFSCLGADCLPAVDVGWCHWFGTTNISQFSGVVEGAWQTISCASRGDSAVFR